jgi:hypothetical protein
MAAVMSKLGETKPVSRSSIIALDLMRRRAPWGTSPVSAYSEEGQDACRWMRRLSEAMIVQGLEDLHSKKGYCDGLKISTEEATRRRRSARRWFKSDSYAAMSFAQCAETMGLDPDATCEAIMAMDKVEVDDITRKYRRVAI